ncbi:MAG: nucleotidyltransferase family protein [Microthrixaceae bacterium]
MTTAAVVLAAGAGTRFAASGGGVPKVLAELDGRPLVDLVLTTALAAGLDEVVLVEGGVDLAAHANGVVLLHNPRWREGIATSLQVAVAHARDRGHAAIVVGLADQPRITTSAWQAVAAAPPTPPIAVATYAGRRGNPVRVHASIFDLLPLTGDEGARALMRERPELVREVPCSGEPWDVDTVEDLER